MHGQFGLLSPGKASSHCTALPTFFLSSCFLCAVFSWFHTTGCDALYSFTTCLYEIFLRVSCVQCFRVSIPPAVVPTLLRHVDMRSLTCAQLKFGCVPYTEREVRHKQVCTRVDSEGQKRRSSPRATTGSEDFGFQFPRSTH